MATRRALVTAVAVAGAVAAALIVACSDPYGGAEPEPAEAGSDAAAVDATTSDVAPPEALDAGPFEDVITIDAQAIDASDCTTCDCDEDGFNRAGCIGDATDAGAIDCDDNDPNRRPNQGFVASPPPASQILGGDWNCSQVVERLYPTNVTCSAFTTQCDTHSGFVSDPPCGTSGDFLQCAPGLAGLSCMNGPKTKRTQACK